MKNAEYEMRVIKSRLQIYFTVAGNIFSVLMDSSKTQDWVSERKSSLQMDNTDHLLVYFL